MKSSSLSGPAGAGTAFLNIALLFYVTGYASPYWLKKTNFPAARSGLWTSCQEEELGEIINGTFRSKYAWKCYDTKAFVDDGWNNTWIPGVRALASIGLILLVTAVIMSDVYACGSKTKGYQGLVFSTMCMCFATWFTTLTAVIIYGIRRFDNMFNGYHFSWGFALQVTASVLIFFAMVFYFLEVAMLNNEAIQDKTGGPGNFLYHRMNRQVSIQSSSYPNLEGSEGNNYSNPEQPLRIPAVFNPHPSAYENPSETIATADQSPGINNTMPNSDPEYEMSPRSNSDYHDYGETSLPKPESDYQNPDSISNSGYEDVPLHETAPGYENASKSIENPGYDSTQNSTDEYADTYEEIPAPKPAQNYDMFLASGIRNRPVYENDNTCTSFRDK